MDRSYRKAMTCEAQDAFKAFIDNNLSKIQELIHKDIKKLEDALIHSSDKSKEIMLNYKPRSFNLNTHKQKHP